MGNTEIEKIMIEKFRISKEQSEELRGKIDQYIEDFEDKNLYESLHKYLELELKKTYQVNGIGKGNIKEVSAKCIDKKNDWNNLEGYYSFVGYILTLIGQLTCFIPSELVAIYTFVISVVTVLILNKFGMKIARRYAKFLKAFNNNFPGLIIISVIACLAINISDNGHECASFFSVVAVLGVNIGLILLCLLGKYLQKTAKTTKIKKGKQITIN